MKSAPSKKRKYVPSEDEQVTSNKKKNIFSMKEFRKQLTLPERSTAINKFLDLLNDQEHDYILDYLENGGSVLELLQTLENDSQISTTHIFSIIGKILLKIKASYIQYYKPSYEACKYLINNYLPVMNKMLGISSSKEERKTCLKLLTAVVTLSTSLAKDILLNVKFNSINMQLFNTPSVENKSVRRSFIHFLTAFLIDMDAHTFSIFLERSSLLTSVIPGLQYDNVDTLCLIITAMKNHILENPSVMKTTKMHVFNTLVVRNIVNLYNWKGPGGLKTLEKNYKGIFEPDEVGREQVRECVHAFLLVLCTSHKFGVIFKDPLVGLGKKNQNSLMYTVLESLDRPWEHQYPRDLVIQICKACPDLTKNVWNMLKPNIEPYLSESWLKAMNFIIDLVNEIKPPYIEHCIKDLNVKQLAQLIQILVSPFGILNVLLPENNVNNTEVKEQILTVIFHMLNQIGNYLLFIKNLISEQCYEQLKELMSGYIERNYPSGETLFANWNNFDEKDATVKYLSKIIDITNMYQILAPELLNNLNSNNIDLDQLFRNVSSDSDNLENAIIQRKIFNVFIDIDPSKFMPTKDLFAYGISLFLKLYFEQKSKITLHVLHNLLKNTGIFDDCLNEMNIWINGIFNLDSISDEFIKTFLNMLIDCSTNLFEYQKELSQCNADESSHGKSNIIEFLLNFDNEDVVESSRPIRNSNNLSPFIIVLLKQDNLSSKCMRQYMEFVLLNLFHCQSNLRNFASLIKNQNATSVIPSNILNYIENWSEGNCIALETYEGTLSFFTSVSKSFLLGTDNQSQDHDYPYFYVDILRIFTFYFSNLIHYGIVLPSHSSNWLGSIDYLIKHNLLNDNCLEMILENSKLIKQFRVSYYGQKDSAKGICTETVLNLVKLLKGTNQNIDRYLKIYSDRTYYDALKIIKKPHAYLNCHGVEEFLDCFQLPSNQLLKLIGKITELFDSNELIKYPIILEILILSIRQSSNGTSEILLKANIVFKLTSYIVDLAKDNSKISALTEALTSYFGICSNSISHIHNDLFSSILQTPTYNKEYAELIVFLLEKNIEKYMPDVVRNIELVAEKKGLILAIVDLMIRLNAPDTILKILYEHLESSIVKALQKPQKIGQHFRKTSELPKLLDKFFPIDKCVPLINKVQKFEISEIFHVKLLQVCFNKVINEMEIDSKQIANILLTFIHLEMPMLKKNEHSEELLIKLNEITAIFNEIIEKIITKYPDSSLDTLATNETFKTFTKLIINLGMSGHEVLLETLKCLLQITPLDADEVKSLFELLQNHSEFLNVILGEQNKAKFDLLALFSLMCQKWPEFLEKNHVAIVLAAYNATITKCDTLSFQLLKFFELKHVQSNFYDFKPFIWGRIAAIDYSVKDHIKNPLFKQPKISDVLGNLKEDLVNYTITNYPLVQSNRRHEINERKCYDVNFFLPLFSHILAPEQPIKTYMFTRSGALSLTVICLCNQEEKVRQAASHVLNRFYCHLETNQTGKDNMVWIRFVQVLCGGIAAIPGHKLNTFAAIFFARTTLILTNPKHVMYLPLSSYLTAKSDLNLNTIPELYTLFFSPQVNFKEHRIFILKILRDGLITDTDFNVFLKSMSFKLFCEFFSSCLSDLDTKHLILDVIQTACKLPVAVNVLCEHYSLLALLYNWVLIEGKNYNVLFSKIANVATSIEKIRRDENSSKLIKNIKDLVKV